MTTENMPPEKTAAQWLLLPFRYLLKALIVAAFLVYVLAGVSATMDLYQRTLLRTQDTNVLYAVIDDSVQKNDPKLVSSWLHARPLEETDQLVKMIIPKSPVLSYNAFFEIFQREQKLGRTEEALFWLQLGRFRLRYDTYRCGAEEAGLKAFEPILNLAQSPETDALMREHPALLKKTVQRVLDFDAKYPAHNDPGPICKTLNQELPVEEHNWEPFRQLLRKHTEKFLQDQDQVKAKSK